MIAGFALLGGTSYLITCVISKTGQKQLQDLSERVGEVMDAINQINDNLIDSGPSAFFPDVIELWTFVLKVVDPGTTRAYHIENGICTR